MKYYVSQRNHTKRRFKERFGIDLTSAQYNLIVNAIRDHSNNTEDMYVEFLYKETNTRKIYLLIWNKKEFIIVYHSGTKQVCTVLPEDSNIRRFLKKEE